MNPHLAANARYGTNLSYIIWLATYVLGGLVAYLIYPFVEGQGPVMAALWMNVAATMVIFMVSSVFHNASLYDAYWSIGPVFTVLFWWSFQGFDTFETRKVMAFVAVGLWSLRLTSNWVRGWPGLHHEDWRFQDLRAKTGGLLSLGQPNRHTALSNSPNFYRDCTPILCDGFRAFIHPQHSRCCRVFGQLGGR